MSSNSAALPRPGEFVLVTALDMSDGMPESYPVPPFTGLCTGVVDGTVDASIELSVPGYHDVPVIVFLEDTFEVVR